MESVPCHVCLGTKLKKDILKYKIGGLNYSEIENLELTDLKAWLDEFNYKDIMHSEREPVAQTIKSILVKINSLIDLNVGYLSLSRNIPSLSCGEKQRVRIANQINCFLRYILRDYII